MPRQRCIQWLLSTILFLAPTFAIPPISNTDIDGLGLLPYGGSAVNPVSPHLEVRGVVGGRKKRYLIERAESKRCCRDKLCKSLLGEILDKDCKCQKCPLGKFPALSGKDCQDACPGGTVKTPDGKGCCPQGHKQNPTGDACELDCGVDRPGPDGKCPPNKEDEEERKKRKGKCPDGLMLDPKEGPQDINAPNPVCSPDDVDKCKPGEIPETRNDGDNDPKKKQNCGKPDPNNRAKCNSRKHYTHIQVTMNADGTATATEKCRTTRQYRQRKKARVEKYKFWKQKKFDEEKAKKEKEQKEKEEREQREREEQQKRKELNDRKKRRMGQCLPVTALLEGIGLGLAKRSAPFSTREEEHPYEWTAEYFDEDFVQADDILQYWPADLVDFDPSDGIDTDAFAKDWDERLSHIQLESDMITCNGRKRCQRSTGWVAKTHESFSARNKSTITRNADAHGIERRFIWILAEIGAFAGRMAAAWLPRIGSAIGRVSPRLAEIVKDSSRLFQVAKSGQGARGGLEAMKNAAARISTNKNWKECLKGGKPL